jgi:hypothetical protein
VDYPSGESTFAIESDVYDGVRHITVDRGELGAKLPNGAEHEFPQIGCGALKKIS